MKICIHQYMHGTHSWGIVGQHISRILLNKGHEVHIFPTLGIDKFPKDLLPHIKEKFDNDYDVQLSYTAPHNFGNYLNHSIKKKNRFGIWCYEWPIIPTDMRKHYLYVDKILAPTNFARDVFINNHVPQEKVVTVPHGITLSDYDNKNKLVLKTKKSKIIGVNIGQPHLRKNIKGMLHAFGLAFNKTDDVCLVAKISTIKDPMHRAESDVFEIIKEFKKKFPNHAELELITQYVPNIVELYNSCDIIYTLSYAEGFYLPGIEAMGCNKINIAPRYGGQLDYMNDDNSLLVDGKIIRADKRMQYWEQNVMNTVFDSDVNDAAAKLKLAVFDYDRLVDKFSPHMKNVVDKLSWGNVADQIISLCV